MAQINTLSIIAISIIMITHYQAFQYRMIVIIIIISSGRFLYRSIIIIFCQLTAELGLALQCSSYFRESGVLLSV